MKTKWTRENGVYFATIEGCAVAVCNTGKPHRWNVDIDGGSWMHWAWKLPSMAEAKLHAEIIIRHCVEARR